MTREVPESVPAKPVDPYGTYIPGRNPEWKTHRIYGHAKTALKNTVYSGTFRHDCALYELTGDVYVPILRVSAGTSCKDYPELAGKVPTYHQMRLEIEAARRRAEAYAREAEEAKAKYEELRKKGNVDG